MSRTKVAISSYDNITKNADGSADLYFGPKVPAGLESNWLDTSASKGWWVWFRFHSPKEPFFDKSWQAGLRASEVSWRRNKTTKSRHISTAGMLAAVLLAATVMAPRRRCPVRDVDS